MSLKELKKMSKNQLESKLKDYEEALMNHRFQKVLQQLENPFSIRFTKRNIARIKTLLKENDLGLRKADK
tara:strand:- start:994 stop:1203 length:210 start_codon:yes stop_codon:yes gene_type:complete